MYNFSSFIKGLHTPLKIRQRKMGHDQDVVVETKTGTNSVKFKETEFQAKVQSRLLTLRFGAYGLLSLVMTLPWLMSFILVYSGADPILWYPFIIFLGLQVSKYFFIDIIQDNIRVAPFFAFLPFFIWIITYIDENR